jgi:hypothetical protein
MLLFRRQNIKRIVLPDAGYARCLTKVFSETFGPKKGEISKQLVILYDEEHQTI